MRKGTPDGGVECFAILEDGSEWGWQAKYVDDLGKSQWGQIDKSVRTALETHPRLTRYYICTPQDRPDARTDGTKSALERWNDHVQTWTAWTQEQGRQVEFIYWGSQELLERLSKPGNRGTVRFWFDAHAFDAVWFNSRLKEAIDSAGPRYTPQVHVDLPIALDLDAFGRTGPFFDRVKSLARKLRDQFNGIGYPTIPDLTPALALAVKDLTSTGHVILTSFGELSHLPAGPLPFQAIIDLVTMAEGQVETFLKIVADSEKDFRPNQEGSKEGLNTSGRTENPFRQWRSRAYDLSSTLENTRESLAQAAAVSGNSLLVLRGEAGTGKTHLLCDITKGRIEAGLPTVLLMGQRFTSTDDPWAQALQHVDLKDVSAEEFAGALESAAQAANSRALVLIDAVNEGAGRIIWPAHVAAFLAQLERSPWIGVVLSVRTTYEEFVLPQEILSRAVRLEHHGFADHEYDAARTFFVHYGLELPSTPLLAPEFRNPLFLKTLCKGLHDNGETRLPRGFQGITAVFDLYLKTINEKLAKELGFNSKKNLVRQGLEAIARELLESDKRWLDLSRAETILNALHPGQEYEKSLYRGFVSEGLLIEDIPQTLSGNAVPAALIGYERMADHLVAKSLLDKVLPAADPATLFDSGKPLAFVQDGEQHIPPGLLEALCVQVPERTGQELPVLAPKVMERWGIGNAYRQSLIWRSQTAFTEKSRELLNQLLRDNGDFEETMEFLLTVAVLPGHPFNGKFLDNRLRKDSMPDRDSWWSTYAHNAWRTQGALDRLVDWAGSVALGNNLDEEAVDLGAIVLGWLFSSSNRYLRDHATLALSNLLSGRPMSIVRLIDRFAGTDDLYVLERIYGISYGAIMKMHDSAEVGQIAQCVYNHVFESGTPPIHILLRDYARGIVERALYLGSNIQVDPARIRPPFKTDWPMIPSADEIKPFLPDWTRGDHDAGDLEWARNSIGSSVMNGDFAHYVIGTNSSSTSSHWLALRLSDPPWQPPPKYEDLIAPILAGLSEPQKAAWKDFEKADQDLESARITALLLRIESQKSELEKSGGQGESLEGDVGLGLEVPDTRETITLEKVRAESLTRLKTMLPEDAAVKLENALKAKAASHSGREPPGFDLTVMQRYILQRVFHLGWTKERFGKFDRFDIGNHGREASKAERIGKKYQWIAYHEILAFLSDHFQFREGYGQEKQGTAILGPWQEDLRDIAPSRPVKLSPEDREDHIPTWWADERFENWNSPPDPHAWVQRKDNLPKVDGLLVSTNPADGTKWVNLQCHFNWIQAPPPDREYTDYERREIWYSCTGYLIPEGHAQGFVDWARKVDFWGRWMPGVGEVHQVFLGEHGWAPSSRHYQQQYEGDVGWKSPDPACPSTIHACTLEYVCSTGGLDCSIKKGFRLKLPIVDLMDGMGLKWSGKGADFLDRNGRLNAFDPSAHGPGPSALLVREDALREYLAANKLSICWAILGEKRHIGRGVTPKDFADIHVTGAFHLSDKGPQGFTKWLKEKRRRSRKGE